MSQTHGVMGSVVSVPKLTEFIRHAAQDMQGFAQLANEPTGSALGKNAGDTVRYTFFTNLSITGGVIAENSRIPRGTIQAIQGSYVLQEYGAATDWTGKLQDLADLPVEDGFVQALVDDMHKAQNTAAFLEFDDTDWIANFSSSGDEFRTDGTPASFSNATNEDLTLDNLRFVVRKARLNLIPFFDGESYIYISGVESLDNLCFDSEVQTQLANEHGRASLNGEVGRLAKCRLVEDTHKIGKVAVGNVLDVGYLVGADAVVNEYAIAPEVRAEDADFGREVAVAWYFIAAWKKIYSQSLHSKEHVIKVTAKP